MPSTSLSTRTPAARRRTQRMPLIRATAWTAAALCIAIALIHLKDQGGFPGSKSPGYVAWGYYLLEAAGLVAAYQLVTRATSSRWLLALGVAAGPLVGYILSRGPGLPSYTDDRGNWSEPIGLISLAAEGALLLIALVMLARPALSGRPAQTSNGPRSGNGRVGSRA